MKAAYRDALRPAANIGGGAYIRPVSELARKLPQARLLVIA